MIERRRGAWGGLRGAVDRMLELWRVYELLETVGGVLRRGGGLNRRRLLLMSIRGSGGELDRSAVPGRLTGDAERRRTRECIA